MNFISLHELSKKHIGFDRVASRCDECMYSLFDHDCSTDPDIDETGACRSFYLAQQVPAFLVKS